MGILSYSELNSALITAKAGSPFYSQFLADSLEVLYQTGCRPIEVFDQNRWQVVDLNTVSVQAAKGNNVRLIDRSVLPLDFVEWVGGGLSAYRLATYSKVSNLYHHTLPINQIFVGAKQSDLYSFRYRYVKSLVLSGMTDEQIRVAMGWINVSMVDVYSDAVLYN